MTHSTEFLQLLEAGDIDGLRDAWATVMPGLPQPETYMKAEIAMHMARTACEGVTVRSRVYSHCWLEERALPSQLPDRMKPAAERLYPRVAEAVGISVNTSNIYLKPAALEVRRSMEDAVNDCYADSASPDPVVVQKRMAEMRDRTYKALFGR